MRKPRFLCLHGFRTSGEIMKIQLHKWPKSVIDRLDLVFLDAPFPCQGKSDVEGIFDPPYYEWFQFNKVPWLFSTFFHFILSIRLYLRWNFQIQEFTEYTNFENCLEYLEDRMIKLGPFDGLIGFSQVIIYTFQFSSTVSDFCTLFQIPNLIFAGCNFVWGFTRTAS